MRVSIAGSCAAWRHCVGNELKGPGFAYEGEGSGGSDAHISSCRNYHLLSFFKLWGLEVYRELISYPPGLSLSIPGHFPLETVMITCIFISSVQRVLFGCSA